MRADQSAIEILNGPGMRRALVLGCLLMTLTFSWYTLTRAPKLTHGFAAYYTYARMLLEGEDLQRAYDFPYFHDKISEYGIHGIKDIPHNIPTNAFMFAPIAVLTPEPAKIVLSAASFTAIIISLFLLMRLYGVGIQTNLGLALTILFFAWRPIYENIYLGQAYALLLLLFCISACGIGKADSTPSPISIALAFLLKGNGVIPLGWLVVNRRWQSLLIACMAILLLGVATLPFTGIGTWSSYRDIIVSTLGTNPTDAGPSYQTINSLVFHLFTYDQEWLPDPSVILPTNAARLISYTVNILVIAIVLIAGRCNRSSQSPTHFFAAVATGVVTAPLAEEYAFTLFLPLVVGMVVAIAGRVKNISTMRIQEWTSFAAILILAIPIRYESHSLSAFPVTLLAYPKLVAGITLLMCYARMASRGYFESSPSWKPPKKKSP